MDRYALINLQSDWAEKSGGFQGYFHQALTLLGGFLPWLMLWANINSGPWMLHNPEGMLGLIHAGRVLVLFAVVPISAVMIFQHRSGGLALSWSGPCRLLLLYGIVALICTIFSPIPWYAFYRGLAFVAVLLAADAVLGGPNAHERAKNLMILTYIIVGLFVMGIVIVGRSVIFSGELTSGPRLYHEIPTVAGMDMSRNSGVTRWAAVPGLVAFARLWYGRRWSRYVWFGLFCFCTFIIISMQSRGGLFGYVASLALIVLLQRGGTRVLLFTTGLLIVAVLIEASLLEVVWEYLRRGQEKEQFLSLTGRTRDWATAWEIIKQSPLLGHGNWTDRAFIGQHVHNAFIQAVLYAGLIGFIPYLASWVVGWRLFLRLWKVSYQIPNEHRQLLLEAGAILAFFTVRSIPETTSASHSIDLMAMVPALAYIEIMARKYRVFASRLG